jgi:hypothetical protein
VDQAAATCEACGGPIERVDPLLVATLDVLEAVAASLPSKETT